MEKQKMRYASKNIENIGKNLPEIIKKNLPEKLKTFRTISGLTTNEVGQLLNKTPTTVTMWEKGKALPDIGTLFKLRNIYNIADLNEFFDENISPDAKSFTKSEQELVALWRKAPSSVRASIKNILKHIK